MVHKHDYRKGKQCPKCGKWKNLTKKENKEYVNGLITGCFDTSEAWWNLEHKVMGITKKQLKQEEKELYG